MYRYLVVYEKTETGYSAYIPDLPGCIATGYDKAATENAIYEAAKFHLEGMKLENNEIPKGSAESEILVFN